MGLDITAYEKIELVEPTTYDELKAKDWNHPLYDTEDHVMIGVIHEDYRDRCPLPEGFYKTGGKRHGFRAGSYGGYNEWRRHLAELIDTTPEAIWKGGPAMAFGELIHFSDAEGTLKSETCAKLAKDFAFWHAEATKYADRLGGEDGRWFLDRYATWREAFELAAGGGAVRFH
jgi:hypothetical protein